MNNVKRTSIHVRFGHWSISQKKNFTYTRINTSIMKKLPEQIKLNAHSWTDILVHKMCHKIFLYLPWYLNRPTCVKYQEINNPLMMNDGSDVIYSDHVIYLNVYSFFIVHRNFLHHRPNKIHQILIVVSSHYINAYQKSIFCYLTWEQIGTRKKYRPSSFCWRIVMKFKQF